MSLHLSTGFVITPRPETPGQLIAVTVPLAPQITIVWPRKRDDFDPVVRAIETIEEE